MAHDGLQVPPRRPVNRMMGDEELLPGSTSTIGEKSIRSRQPSNELSIFFDYRYWSLPPVWQDYIHDWPWRSGSGIFVDGKLVVVGSCVAGGDDSSISVKGPIIDFPSRFLDESVGFAVGWMAWFAYINLTATEVSAVASLFKFHYEPSYLQQVGYPQDTLEWKFGLSTASAVWVGMALLVILLINLLPVRVYGEIEYVFGCMKLMVIVAMIMMGTILNANSKDIEMVKGPFTYYQSPRGFFSNQTQTDPQGDRVYTFTGGTGRLIGIWSAMNTIFFSLQGFFTVSVTAAENKHVDRDETIKLASRKIALRVIILYALVVFTTGLNVPYDDRNLADRTISSIRRGQNSPIIISLVRNGVMGWPHFFNAFYIFSALSCGINGLYISSRLLHALASIRNVWPATGWGSKIKMRLERTNSKGVPVNAVIVSWLFAFLGFLAVKPEPAKLLGRLAIFSTCSMLIVYICTSASFLSFKRLTLNGDPDEGVTISAPDGTYLNRNASDYPYKSHGQWVRAAYALVGCVLLVIFNGWRSFLNPFSQADFLAAYMAIPIFIVVVVLYHLKDEPEWLPWRWRLRRTMDIANPVATREKDPELRKGRLHRVDTEVVFSGQNVRGFFKWVWVWMK